MRDQLHQRDAQGQRHSAGCSDWWPVCRSWATASTRSSRARRRGQPGRDMPVQRSFLHYMTSRRDTQLALLATLLLLPGLLFDELLPGLGVHSVLIDVSSIAAMLLAGSSVMRNAWRSLTHCPPAQHQRADVDCSHRRGDHRRIHRGGGGDGAVRHRRGAGGLHRRARPRLHPQPDDASAQRQRCCWPDRNGRVRRATVEISSAARRRPHPGQAGRAHSHGWAGDQRRVGGQPGAHHRREPAGGERARRARSSPAASTARARWRSRSPIWPRTTPSAA